MCVVLPRILARETRCASPVASLPARDAPSALSLVASLKRPPVSSAIRWGVPAPPDTRPDHRVPVERIEAFAAFEILHHVFRPWRRPRGFLATPLETSAPDLEIAALHRHRTIAMPGHSFPSLRSKAILSTAPVRQARAGHPRPQASGLDGSGFRSIGEWLFGTKECSLASSGIEQRNGLLPISL